MEDPGAPRGANRLGRYFGLETKDKIVEVLAWTAPFLGLLALGLVGAALLVQWLFPLPPALHVVAIVLALAYFFLFLARVRRAAEEASERGDGEPPGSGPER